MLKPPSPPSSPNKIRNNNIGFIDEISGDVDGLMSCTESLGFESSDERRVDVNNHDIHQDQIHGTDNHENDDEINKKVMSGDWRSRSRRGREWTKVRSFPPPLKSLNRNGEPSFFLRPVRKDGRLELTEVRIHRPQILHASRHDGRLTLHLVPDHNSFDLEEDDDEEEQEGVVEQEQEVVEEDVHEQVVEQVIVEEVEEQVIVDEAVEEQVRVHEEEEEEEKEEEEEEEIGYEKEEEGGFGEWRFGKEGLRRCHEMVNQHHHHHHHGSHHIHHHNHLRMCGISIV